MNATLTRIAPMIAASLCATSLLPNIAHAQTYQWLTTWTYNTAFTSATANAPGLGPVTVSVTGATATLADWPIRFDNVAFSPTTVAATPAARKSSLALTNWTTTVDLTGLANTAGVVVGVGNFGFGSGGYPGYQLRAFDWCGAPMSLTSGFTVLGSYDHTWLNTNQSFNDNLVLNLTTGVFSGTVVPGVTDGHSDIMLISLPAHVGRLEVVPATAAGSGGDTIDVVVSTPHPCSTSGCLADVDDGSGTGTPDGGVTIDDLLYFLQRFEAGC